MSSASALTLLMFPGTPTCVVSGNKIVPRFLTTVIIAGCRKSCEDLADTLDGKFLPEHQTINDCLAACDEYTIAAARESKHTMLYAVWCAERCDDLLAACGKIDTPAARSTAKWLKTASKQMNREIIAWKQVREIMVREVTWDSVKEMMNKEVIAFDPFGSSLRRQQAQAADGR